MDMDMDADVDVDVVMLLYVYGEMNRKCPGSVLEERSTH